ncbi:MAG TPA: ABC transporter permease [Bacillota bacterium]|nr:ABC transporter permease [Bacillota bacterium]
MRRKWTSLPLLLLFPFFIIGFLIVGIVTFFMPPENEPLQVGLVDKDKSEETELIIHAFIEQTDLANFLQVISVEEEHAEEMLHNDEISAYVMFPEGFTKDLYHGQSIEIPVIGSEKHMLETELIYQFVRSIMRLIETAQANILTIYAYAEELPMEEAERTDILFDEFKDFFFYTIHKDDILRDDVIQNKATFSPIHYFSMAGFFFTSLVWSFLFYVVLYKETSSQILTRMRLYGVKASQFAHGRIIVAYLYSFMSTLLLFFMLRPFFYSSLDTSTIMQVIGLCALSLIIFMLGLALIDQLFTHMQFRFTVQLMYTVLCIVLSGALIPRMYFPLSIQSTLDWIFTTHTFDNLLHIGVFDGIFVSFAPLWITLGVLLILYSGISLWKGRFER